MEIYTLLLFLVTVTCCNCQAVVFTTNGFVLGTRDISYSGRIYSIFEGIPYAQAPIGHLRFEPPKERSHWQGIRYANTKTICLQASSIFWDDTTPTVGEEDCLHLNVYVPRKFPSYSTHLDVIVHFHSSAFTYGGAHHYAGPKYLMDKEVILVTVNYRLGAFGYLSTEDEVVPGNNGMKDQVLSLKWIQKNIRYFGGNPNSVTLTGTAAGGASVHLHYFSPLSKGLFHRGFSEGGTALSPWVLQEAALEKAKRLANLVGCPSQTSAILVNCLKTKPGHVIAVATKVFSPVVDFLPFPFTPIIEKQHAGAFLTQQPYKMLIDKTVANLPWIVGATEEQGSLYALILKNIIPELKYTFKLIAPNLLDYNYTIADEDKMATSIAIEKFYFSGSYTFENLAKLMGDRLFDAAADVSAKLQAKANTEPVYFYIMKYRGEHSFAEMFGLNSASIGASLGDSVLYYLNTSISNQNLNQGDKDMVSIFTQWLTKYTQYSYPEIGDVIWEPVTGDQKLEYLCIQSPVNIFMEKIQDFGFNSFWNKLPFQENQNLI